MAQSARNDYYGKALAKAWSDPAFKARLLANPAAAVTELGVTPPQGKTLHVVENTDTEFYLVLPQLPKGVELSDQALDEAVGGGCSSSCCEDNGESAPWC